jgi:fructose-1,6-bisphosphatase/inositol monophosphatase family enzyme
MQQQMLAALDKASAIALDFFGLELTRQAKNSADDFVTEADLAVSSFLCDWIQQNFPGHGIQCEELAERINPTARKRWLIDPIDGTWNFANKDPLWAILLAYLEDDEPTLGAIATPATRAKYFAEKGAGATCNGARLSVRHKESIHGAFNRLLDSQNGHRG